MAKGIKNAAEHHASLGAIIILFDRNFQPYFCFREFRNLNHPKNLTGVMRET
jgi:hypothetical protein